MRPRVGNGGAEYSRSLSASEAKITVTSASWPLFHLLLLLTYYTILGPESRTLSAAIYMWPWTWTTRACPDSRARLRLRIVSPDSFLGVCAVKRGCVQGRVVCFICLFCVADAATRDFWVSCGREKLCLPFVHTLFGILQAQPYEALLSVQGREFSRAISSATVLKSCLAGNSPLIYLLS